MANYFVAQTIVGSEVGFDSAFGTPTNPATTGGFTIELIRTGGGAGTIEVYLTGNAVSYLTGKNLWINGTEYIQAGSPSFDGTGTGANWTAGGFVFVNGRQFSVEFGNAFLGPVIVGLASTNFSAATFNITFANSNRIAGDLLVVVIETENQAIAAPSGFAEFTSYTGTPSRGTAGAAGGVRITVFTKVSVGTETTVGIPDSGQHQIAHGYVLRGRAGQAIEIAAAIAGNNTGTSGSFTAPASTAADALIAFNVASDRDAAAANWSGFANAGLLEPVEIFDTGTSTANGGGVALFSGGKSTAGSVSNGTATHAANVGYAWITLAVQHVSSGGATYNESLTESGGAGESSTTSATFPNAQSEAVTSSASQGVGLSIPVIRAEALTTLASEAAALVHGLSLSEIAASGESSATSATLTASATEAVTSADVGGMAATWPTAHSETIAANDNATAAQAMSAARAEDVAADDDATGLVVGGAVTYDDVLSEAVTASESAAASLMIAAALAEAVMGNAARAASATWLSVRSEAIAAADLAQGVAQIGSALSETATGAVSQNVTGIFAGSIDELVAANDDDTASVSANEALSETAAAADEYEADGGNQVGPREVPDERTAIVPAEARVAVVPSDQRRAAIPSERRTAAVPAETRSIAIPAAPRESTVPMEVRVAA